MKKTLLTLGAALLLSTGAFAQLSEADAMNSDISQNMATTTKKGYTFNYTQGSTEAGDAKSYNCFDNQGADGMTDVGAQAAFDFVYNTDSSYAEFTFDGTQGNGWDGTKAGTEYIWNRLTTGNCASETIDLSDATLQVIKAKVMSSVDVPSFYIGAVVQMETAESTSSTDLKAVLADANATEVVSLKAGEWKEIEFKVATKGWFTPKGGTTAGNNDVDLTQVVGIFLFPRDVKTATTSPSGKIAIDYITLGDGEPVALTDAEIAVLDVKVFPNPASDVVNVSYNVPADEQVTVTLSNSLGQAVASVEGDASSASIDVAGLNGGLYFASVVVDGIVVATQKVIVE